MVEVIRFPGGDRVENGGGGGHLETEVGSIKETLGRLEPKIVEIHAFSTAIIPTLATKVELADMKVSHAADASALKAEMSDLRAAVSERPSKAYLWGVMGVMIATVLAATIGGATLVSLFK